MSRGIYSILIKCFAPQRPTGRFSKGITKKKSLISLLFHFLGFAPDITSVRSVRVGASWKLSGRLGSSKHKLLSAILDIEYVSGSSANSLSFTKHLT